MVLSVWYDVVPNVVWVTWDATLELWDEREDGFVREGFRQSEPSSRLLPPGLDTVFGPNIVDGPGADLNVCPNQVMLPVLGARPLIP
jgi:hypothetical protein